MKMTHGMTIGCNAQGCLATHEWKWADATPLPDVMRYLSTDARQLGWYVSTVGGPDFCPRHVSASARKALAQMADVAAEWDEDDPMPEQVETAADHGADAVVDDATGVIGRVWPGPVGRSDA